MSDVTSRNQSRNQVAFDYDYSKIFLWDNKYRKINIANASGSDLVLTAGMLIGAVGGTYQVYKSGTSNISVVGILAESVTIVNGTNADVDICVSGRVNSSKLVFDGTDALTTVVSNRTIQDRLAADTLGIEVAVSDELTKTDN
jgi:hypothetical protein